MRTLVHLSDLHFGRLLPETVQPCLAKVKGLAPDLVVVSGDLTQRARKKQYAQAKAFLAALPQPQLVLPGNHDVPAYNLYRRLMQPLDRYKRIITGDLSPRFVDEEMAVFGINTARALVIKGGRINQEQLERLEADVQTLTDHQVKIVVVHHPLDLPEHLEGVRLVERADHAMRTFARCRIDFFLAGHLHLALVGSTARYGIPGYRVPIFQAGTTISSRARGEPNSFFVHTVDRDEISTATYMWDAGGQDFTLSETHHFSRTAEGWSLSKAEGNQVLPPS
jgi:3',5'-cyclic AMP phosphodiesterase CpdA